MKQLLMAETAERQVRSITYQMTAARFPAHRDLKGFDFAQGFLYSRPVPPEQFELLLALRFEYGIGTADEPGCEVRVAE
jgi:hypothetical protein